MLQKGTLDGIIDEIQFVKKFNLEKKNFLDYLSYFEYNHCFLWMVQVTSHQKSSLNDKKVPTRADCYLVRIHQDINNLLTINDYFLSEKLLDFYNIAYEKVPYSGISIKMTTSNNFQILKLVPSSFYMLFGSYELGAGASLFCLQQSELNKNIDVIRGWNTTCDKMLKYFRMYTNGNKDFYLNKQICSNIKNYSCNTIKSDILNSTDLQQKIFNGIGLYEEPYTAHYFYHGIDIVKLEYIDFIVTTGSGRTKGIYTIVLKPK